MTEAEQLIDALRSLRPFIESLVPFGERERRLHPEVAAAFAHERLYRLWIPRTFGGLEMSVPEAARVFEAAAKIDGSAGWAVTIGVGGGLFAATLPPETARAVFERPDALIAGSGSASGTALRKRGDTYRASGQWAFASGIHYATTVTANCLVSCEDGQPVRNDAGHAVIHAMTFEPAQVEILDTWDTLGMRGSGSHDFRVIGATVPAARTFSVFAEPHEAGPLYRYPFGSIAAVSFAAVALGIARNMLEEFAEFAAEKRPYGREGVLVDTPTARLRMAEAEATLASAREWFFREVQASWDAATSGETLGSDGESRVSLASIHAAKSAVHACNTLFEIGGMAPLFMASTLGRCWRDVHTVSHHGVLSPLNLERPRN